MRKRMLIALLSAGLLLVVVALVALNGDAVITWIDARFFRAPPPPPTGYPEFDAIPYAIGLAVDDLGWRDWTPENSRDPTLEDYQTIVDVGRSVGTRIMTAWIMGDLDQGKILAKPEYNQPIAPSNMTPSGTRWNNTWGVSEDAVPLMELMRDNAAFIEFGLHGISHEHYADRRQQRAEFAHIDEANPGYAESWGWDDMNNKAMAFEELVRQYYDEETSSFPVAFVPPGHAYYYGDDGRGSDESTGALLHMYGVKYANGDTGVATQLGEGGIDHGVLFIDRAYGCNYNWEGCTPWVGDWNDFDAPDYPTDEYGWVEAHFPNLWDAEEDWVTYLRGLNDAPDRMLGRNTVQVSSQWLYRKYASLSGREGVYIIDNTQMVEDAYTYDLLGPLVLKTPLASGEHVQSAQIDGGAQILGYYEDEYGYGYLVIGQGTNPMGRLDRAVYTLEAALGSATMPAYVNLAGATYNVFVFEWGARSASLKIEMYGAQDVRVRLPFIPTEVLSDNPDLEIVSWSWEAPFVTMTVQGRNIQGEVGTIRVEGRPTWFP